MSHRCSPRALLFAILLLSLNCPAASSDKEKKKTNKVKKAEVITEADGSMVVTTKTSDDKELANVDGGHLMAADDDLFQEGLKFHQRGRIKKAIKLYEEAIKEGMCTPDLYNNLALAYRSENRMEEAKKTISTGIDTFPGNELLERNEELILKPPRLKFENIEGVENASTMKEAGTQMFEQALKYQKEGKKNDALDLYVMAEAANNMQPDLHNNLALLYSEMNWPQKACEAWKKGNMLFPDDELLAENKPLIFGGPDGTCGKRRVLQLEGPDDRRAIAPPKPKWARLTLAA